MNIRFQPNTLYYGDCLDIMADFPAECIDLICLDPPFNSNEKYHTIFKGAGLRNIDPQIKAFDDMWLWDPKSAQRVKDIKNAVANPASKVIAGFEQFIPQSKMLSYVSYMAQRLFGMHRILKDTGSIYLHCDPTASHYLKLIMDAIFGEKSFRNEILWCYTRMSAGGQRQLSRAHDIILWYSKGQEWCFNVDDIRLPYAKGSKAREGQTLNRLGSGYSKEGVTKLNPLGKFPEDWVTHIPYLRGKELLGYPTQKPLALYERIIKASSNRGDLVLDPFCGCGTTIDAALKNGRRAIGIDILPFALRLINARREGINLPVQGVPVDKETAFQLGKDDPFKFQDWSISLIDGLAANPQKVGDEGIDGFGMFFHKPDNMEAKAIIVQVTAAAGSQKVKFDKLQSDVRSHNAAMGILLTRDAQTARRNWRVNLPLIQMGETTYDPIQCFSIEEYYRHGQRYDAILKLPPLANPWTGKEMQRTLFDTN